MCNYCYWIFVIVTFTFIRVEAKTQVISIEPCFGNPAPIDQLDPVYHTFSSSSPAFTVRTSFEGLQVKHRPNTKGCYYAFHVPRVDERDAISIYLNWARYVSHKQSNITRSSENTKLNLQMFYRLDESKIVHIAHLTLTSRLRAHEQVPLYTIPTQVTTIYMIITPTDKTYWDGTLYFSVTLTPTYRCVYEENSSDEVLLKGVMYKDLEQTLSYHSGLWLCSKGSRTTPGICIDASLRCDTHYNCPKYWEHLRYTDEPRDRTLCQPLVARKPSQWRVVYTIIAAFLALLLTFTLIFYAMDYRPTFIGQIWRRNNRRIRNDVSGASLNDNSLPVPPPTYEALNETDAKKSKLRNLCPGAPKPRDSSNRYECPPSYVKDARDEVGAIPSFIRKFYAIQNKKCHIVAKKNSKIAPTNDYSISIPDGFQTEDEVTVGSWIEAFNQPERQIHPTQSSNTLGDEGMNADPQRANAGSSGTELRPRSPGRQ